MKKILLLIIVFILMGCQSQQVDSSVQEAEELINPIEVGLYNYRIGEGEDGWQIGRSTIYFLNTSDEVVKPDDLMVYSAELVIKEDSNKTYPITLHTYQEGLEDYSGSYYAMNNGIRDLEFPVTIQPGDGNPLDPGIPSNTDIALHFQFAKVATPASITLKTNLGDIVYPIRDIPQSFPRPDNNNILPMTEFKSRNDLDNDQVKLAFGKKCFRDGGTFYIGYILKNKDMFDEYIFGPYRRYSVIYDDGTEQDMGDEIGNLIFKTTLGPGQQTSDKFKFDMFVGPVGEDPQPEFLAVEENGKRILYEVDCE